MENEIMLKTFMILHQLGITARCNGYFYTAYGVLLAKKQPDRLLLVTKWLYPDIAKQYKTTWQCVERSIRTVISLAWERNPTLLMSLVGFPLERKPSVSQFITILVYNLKEEESAYHRLPDYSIPFRFCRTGIHGRNNPKRLLLRSNAMHSPGVGTEDW